MCVYFFIEILDVVGKRSEGIWILDFLFEFNSSLLFLVFGFIRGNYFIE